MFTAPLCSDCDAIVSVDSYFRRADLFLEHQNLEKGIGLSCSGKGTKNYTIAVEVCIKSLGNGKENKKEDDLHIEWERLECDKSSN
jgi:hypothetical protein